MKKLYHEEELREKSYYDLYEIVIEERILDSYAATPTREQLISLLLKYRGYRLENKIREYNENGFFYVQQFLDRKLGNKLHPEGRIRIPYKIIIYNDLDLTREDNYKIVIPEYVNSSNVFLVNANNYLCGILSLEKDLDSMDEYYLVSKKEFLNLDGLKNSKFSLIFFKERDAKIPYEFYNMEDIGEMSRYPGKIDYYCIGIENFEYRELEKTTAVLCIDFGTANTTAGVYLDRNYVSKLPSNDILNGNIKLDEINYVKFPDGERDYSIIYPTITYIENCKDVKDIKYLFGHDARRKLESNDYIVNGTIFYGLKKWVYENNKKEKIVDEYGNMREVERKEIIKAYLKYVISRAEYLFKCKFTKIHATSPVRLKEQFLNMLQDIFTLEIEKTGRREIITKIPVPRKEIKINLEKKSDKIENTETKNLTNEEILEKFGGHGERADELKNELLISQIEIDKEFAEKEIKPVKTDEINANEQTMEEDEYITEITYIDEVIGNETVMEYEIIRENAMDEAVAVLYNTVESGLKKKNYEEGREYKALVIDCGGGTTDLAACSFQIGSTLDVAYHLEMKTSFENGDENFGGNNLTYRIMQYLKIILANNYINNTEISIENLIPYAKESIYNSINEIGIDKIFEVFEEEYQKAEKIIPTKFSKFENKLSEEYRKIKSNFYLLWEAAENLKREFFKKDDTLRTRFDKEKNYEKSNDFHITALRTWNLYINENGRLEKEAEFPKNVFTIRELEKIVRIDIYEMLRKFLDTYYDGGELQEYALIKLSGQSTKIGIFQDVLKEFVPGRQIEFKTKDNENDGYELKLACLNGAIKYLDYRRFGHMNVTIKNEIPVIPYSVWGKTYKNEDVEIIKTSNRANENLGYIDKVSSVMELKLYLKNMEDDVIREIVYKNDIDFVDKDAKPLIEGLRMKISQNETDNVPNDITRFLVYTDENCWGFYICPIRRKDDQIWMGRIDYYPFEDKINEISFFDGEH